MVRSNSQETEESFLLRLDNCPARHTLDSSHRNGMFVGVQSGTVRCIDTNLDFYLNLYHQLEA